MAVTAGRREAIGLGLAGVALGRPARAADPVDWTALGNQVRDEMRWAWGQYCARAWGKDQIRPISGGFEDFPVRGHSLGLSLIEAMDTLWLMGLDAEFADALGWVKASLSFDVDGEASAFETAIRLVGGLLSAHHCCGDPALLGHARDLADRLMPVFATPTGMPYRFVNLRTGAVRDPMTNPAETGSFIAEFGTLSRLTGDPRYLDAARCAMAAMFDRRSRIGLLADRIDAVTGRWASRRATIGPPSDSFYEYCWDGWDLLGDADCRRMYDTLTPAILKHQTVTDGGRLWFADVDFETGVRLSTAQDALAAFYGGLLAQGGARATGAAYTRSWAAVQARFEILPESYDYASGAALSPSNALRPELADAALALWLIDGREEWRRIGRDHFLAMRRRCRARYGYADVADVRLRPMALADHCPGYWWSEQMKYYWLLFADCPRIDLRRAYLSTEGNLLRGAVRQ